MRGLEIGGGPHPAFPRYDQADRAEWADRGNPTTYLCDAASLPVPDGAYDHVVAINILEHFGWRETRTVLREWWRVVAPGGLLQVTVPDAIGIIRDFEAGTNTWEQCCERLAGSQDYPGNTHLAFFTLAAMPSYFPPEADLELEQTHAGGGATVRARKPR